MNNCKVACLSLLASSAVLAEEISVVTPRFGGGSDGYGPTINVTQDQTIELLSVMSYGGENGRDPVMLEVLKDGVEVRVRPIMTSDFNIAGGGGLKPEINQFLLRGPATIKPRSFNSVPGILTFRITPDRVDPTKTAIVYPGTNNTARVNLISSTNLTDWVIATNGIYSGTVAQFFRIDIQTETKP